METSALKVVQQLPLRVFANRKGFLDPTAVWLLRGERNSEWLPEQAELLGCRQQMVVGCTTVQHYSFTGLGLETDLVCGVSCGHSTCVAYY